MSVRGVVLIIYLLCIAVEVKSNYGRALPNICNQYNNTNKLQCYCTEDSYITGTIKAADCFLINDIAAADDSWNAINSINEITKLTFLNSRGIILKYIPANVFKNMYNLKKVDIRYGKINNITAYAFSNSTSVKEITLRSNRIKALEENAFANHKALNTISLDVNNIIEIKRNVFVNLPSLEKLYLTYNKITTIHNKAFVYLKNLKELEINRNKIFSLNTKTFLGLENLERLDLSGNSLEVISNNTFQTLSNLQSLNLESNHIQILDEKAFNGLQKLYSLTLSRNELKNINNFKVFEGLKSLMIIRLQGNKLTELKTEVLKPIQNNFCGALGFLDIDENRFPCNCRLEWFAELMNMTKNKRFKIKLQNLNCYPDLKLKEMWRNVSQEDENKESSEQEANYEFNAVTQFDGKLLYNDVRDLLNCSTKNENRMNTAKDTLRTTQTLLLKTTTLVTSLTTIPKISTYHNVTINGLLDLSVDNTTHTVQLSQVPSVRNRNVIQGGADEETILNTYTTSQLADVSTKLNDVYEETKMSTDETSSDNFNAAPKSCVSTIVTLLLCYSLLY